MVLDADLDLLHIVLTVLCREEAHVQEGLIQEYIARFANRYSMASHVLIELS